MKPSSSEALQRFVANLKNTPPAVRVGSFKPEVFEDVRVGDLLAALQSATPANARAVALENLMVAANIPLPLRNRAERFLRTSAPHHREREWYQIIEAMLKAATLPEAPQPAGHMAVGLVEWLKWWWERDQEWRELQRKELGPDVAHLMRGVADMIEGSPQPATATKPYDVMADAVNEIADAASEAFRAADVTPGEWDGDNIVQDVKRGIVACIEVLASRSALSESVDSARNNALEEAALLFEGGKTSLKRDYAALAAGTLRGMKRPTGNEEPK